MSNDQIKIYQWSHLTAALENKLNFTKPPKNDSRHFHLHSLFLVSCIRSMSNMSTSETDFCISY